MTFIPSWPVKDPATVRAFSIDLTNLLEDAETIGAIDSVTVTPSGELTVDSSAIDVTGKKVVVVLSGGVACRTYLVTIRVTTTGGSNVQTFERSCFLPVEDR